jgi:hypothetical protein
LKDNIYNASDVLNLHLFFKQLQRVLGPLYIPSEFEAKLVMIAEAIPTNASFHGCEPMGVSLLHYITSVVDIATD